MSTGAILAIAILATGILMMRFRKRCCSSTWCLAVRPVRWRQEPRPFPGACTHTHRSPALRPTFRWIPVPLGILGCRDRSLTPVPRRLRRNRNQPRRGPYQVSECERISAVRRKRSPAQPPGPHSGSRPARPASRRANSSGRQRQPGFPARLLAAEFAGKKVCRSLSNRHLAISGHTSATISHGRCGSYVGERIREVSN